MEYSIYKLDFRTGVHFGTGTLNESAYTFQSDQLFSALYIEALKMREEQELYEMVKTGKLLLSDAFPYKEDKYLIPKPMIYVEPVSCGMSEQKKVYKKMKFLPVESLEEFLNGAISLTKDPLTGYGYSRQQVMAAVRTEEDTLPYHVGVFYYNEGCGLYIITATESAREKELLEKLLEALSYTGIGGKRSSGLGKFLLCSAKIPETIVKYMGQNTERNLLLSTALPRNEEMGTALEGASYQLLKRSGFVTSPEYTEEWRKKKDSYVFAAGSCFTNRFLGDVYDVSDGGKHPVYRYAKPIFMGV